MSFKLDGGYAPEKRLVSKFSLQKILLDIHDRDKKQVDNEINQ